MQRTCTPALYYIAFVFEKHLILNEQLEIFFIEVSNISRFFFFFHFIFKFSPCKIIGKLSFISKLYFHPLTADHGYILWQIVNNTIIGKVSFALQTWRMKHQNKFNRHKINKGKIVHHTNGISSRSFVTCIILLTIKMSNFSVIEFHIHFIIIAVKI